jgi:cytochrome c biogenesis protein CcmG/thiol:disulfide interchange protein DsbE
MRKTIYILVLITLFSCSKGKTTYYKNINSGEIFTELEYYSLGQKIAEKYGNDSIALKINYSLKEKYSSKDSLIQPFGLDVRIGENYIISSSDRDKIYELIGKDLPDFELNTIDNVLFNKSNLLGKPSLINFWFTSCKPCVEEIPELNKLKEKYKSKVNFITITFDKKNVVDRFIDKNSFDFIHIVNAQDYLDRVGVKAFPKNVFIDSHGKVRIVENGLNGNLDEFVRILNNLL